MLKKTKKTKQDNAYSTRGILVTAAGAILAFGLQTAGILIGKGHDFPNAGVVLTISCILPPILLVMNLILTKCYTKKLSETKIEEMQRYFLSQRELAQQTSEQNVAFLRRWRHLTDAYAVLIGCLGSLIAFFSGLRFSVFSGVAFWFYAVYLLIAAFSRIRFHIPTAFMDEDDSLYVSREDYPNLYALAQKAADEMGCGKQIRIALQQDGNVGIAEYGDVASLQIGAFLFNCLSDRELYAILLHEFSHIVHNTHRAEDRFDVWLNYGQTPTCVSGVTGLLFLYPDAVSTFRYMVYQFSTSVLHEAEADRAMLRAGDGSVAASALIKTYYYDRFESENQTYDSPNDFETEEIRPDLASRYFALFKERLAQRRQVWDGLIDSEILANNATHPTLKMRMEAFGVSNARPLPDDSPAASEDERVKALAFLDAQIARQLQEQYPQMREERYLKPLQIVEKWEAEGRPIAPEKYRDVVMALHQIGRSADAEALCERAIAELPDAAAMFACFEKGKILLRRYDPAGLAYMYRAVEGNHNFTEEGMEEIGVFCCMTGNAEELARYRARALELSQRQVDEYSQIGELHRSDNLGTEQLPEGVLEDILAHIRTFEAGSIDKIYLVRKTISPDLFSSAFVVRFVKDCDPELRDEVMHGIFSYLDTVSDWQYSLFDYDDVKRIGVEKIEGSLVYQKPDAC